MIQVKKKEKESAESLIRRFFAARPAVRRFAPGTQAAFPPA